MARSGVMSGNESNNTSGLPRSIQREMSQQRNQTKSRLEQMQDRFQQKILREKEQKLAQMYEENQRRAMDRVAQNSGKGLVRNLFQERRQMAQKKEDLPDIKVHYQMKKNEHRKPPPGNSFHPPPQKNSAGRDRANPLAPIDRSSQSGSNHSTPNHTPKPPRKQKTRPVKPPARARENSQENSSGSDYNVEIDNEDSPPPNLANLKDARRRRYKGINRQDYESSDDDRQGSGKKLTDFQKWKLEQDQAKERRLEKHRNEQKQNQNFEVDFDKQGSQDDDEDDNVARQQEIARQREIARQEEEIMRKIAEQKAALERMQQERLREEEEERKEEERRRKREAAEKERRRRLQAAEMSRRQEEEDDRESVHEQYQKQLRDTNHNVTPKPQKAYEPKPISREHKPVTHEPRHISHEPTAEEIFPLKAAKVKKHNQKQKKENTFVRKEPHLEDDDIHGRPKTPPAAFYENAARLAAQAEDENVNVRLVPCDICGRKFAEERMAKHQVACAKTTAAAKKRKKFDTTKMRVEGTDAAQFAGKGGKDYDKKKKKTNWRTKHEEFIAAMRYAKQIKAVQDSGGNIADLPPPPKSENPDYVQCQYCQRKFAPETAERHIPRCKDIKSRPAPPKNKRR